MNKSKKIKLLLRIICGILSIIMLIMLPIVGVKTSDDFLFISSKFVGQKSAYQGIIEVWNIDTFESGTNAKSKYISQVAEIFQKQNKGLYILVRDLSEYECINLLERGEKPDIFSCSYGIAYKLKNYIQHFKNSFGVNILPNLLEAGTENGELYGLAWCKGQYFLISSEENLKKAGVNTDEDIILSKNALNLGYEVKTKKSTKKIPSLTYGVNDYLMPKKALSSYTNKELVIASSYSLDVNVKFQSQYTAYTKFISGQSTILLGTQRDIFRMENRVKNGKVSKIFYEPINTFNDLIQFSFLTKNDDNIKSEISENFAKFLTLEENQKKLVNIGMMPVTGQVNIYTNGIMSDIIPQNFNNETIFSVFISKEEITKFQ